MVCVSIKKKKIRNQLLEINHYKLIIMISYYIIIK